MQKEQKVKSVNPPNLSNQVTGLILGAIAGIALGKRTDSVGKAEAGKLTGFGSTGDRNKGQGQGQRACKVKKL